jgi:hypothetical protein
MCEVSHSPSICEQEVQALFARYLPLQPLPPELAARLKQRVLAEVNMKLHRSFLVWPIVHLQLMWRWRDRRR